MEMTIKIMIMTIMKTIWEFSFQGLINTMNRNKQNIVQQHNALKERVSNIREYICNDNANNNNIDKRFIGQISQQQHLDI